MDEADIGMMQEIMQEQEEKIAQLEAEILYMKTNQWSSQGLVIMTSGSHNWNLGSKTIISGDKYYCYQCEAWHYGQFTHGSNTNSHHTGGYIAP